MEDALTSNQTRAIGVSNFDVGDLETLALSAKVWLSSQRFMIPLNF